MDSVLSPLFSTCAGGGRRQEDDRRQSPNMKVAQLCPTLCDPHGLHTVHGILQARILECVADPFSSGSYLPRNRTGVSCIAGGFFTNLAIREALKTGTYQMQTQYRRSVVQQETECNGSGGKSDSWTGGLESAWQVSCNRHPENNLVIRIKRLKNEPVTPLLEST